MELELSRVWDLPVVSLKAGLGARVSLLQQTFETPGEAGPRRNLAGNISANLGTVLQLPAGFYLLLEAGLQSYAFRITRGTTPITAWEASLVLRSYAGLG